MLQVSLTAYSSFRVVFFFYLLHGTPYLCLFGARKCTGLYPNLPRGLHLPFLTQEQKQIMDQSFSRSTLIYRS